MNLKQNMNKIFTHQKITQVLIWIVRIICGLSFTHYIEENVKNKFQQLINVLLLNFIQYSYIYIYIHIYSIKSYIYDFKNRFFV